MRLLGVALVLAFVLAGCSTPGRVDPGSVPLEEGKGGLLGNVFYRDGRQTPATGATVLVFPGGGLHEVDERGKFVQRDMPPGHYAATPNLEGYEGGREEFDVVAGNYTEIVIFLESGG